MTMTAAQPDALPIPQVDEEQKRSEMARRFEMSLAEQRQMDRQQEEGGDE